MNLPNEKIASTIVAAMTGEEVIASNRFATGDHNFVFGVKTTCTEYVLRLTDANNKKEFVSAIYWQKKLLPLAIPLAEFINIDIEGKYSQYPALLMKRIPGDDLINVYKDLTDNDKRNLAIEIVSMQKSCSSLPEGSGFGFSDSYEQPLDFQSWYDFLLNRLRFAIDIISKTAIFDINKISKVLAVAKEMEENFLSVRSIPFMWDTSERNVLVHDGKISGIVDVDYICFGDPLFVVALTYAALELFGNDTLYPDYWAEFLELDHQAKDRLNFYRLFYTVWFMRKQALTTINNRKIAYDIGKLDDLFQKSLSRLMSNS